MAYLAIDPAQLCSGFFIVSAAIGLATTVSPSVRKLASYGPRTISSSGTVPSTEGKSNNSNVLDKFANFQVPHTWFTHFYAVSVASSAFWACQIATDGAILKLLASGYGNTQGAMTMNQIAITWTLMAFQGFRRLYESITLLKPSIAKMPVASYALGIAFYLVMGVAVWVQGIREYITRKLHITIADLCSYITIQQSYP
jgi:3-oxo-5-alpha-steroid 4-dehydrogenase 3